MEAFPEAMPQLLGFYLISGFQGSDTTLPGAADLTLHGEKSVLAVSWLSSYPLTFPLPFPDFWSRREVTAMAAFPAPGHPHSTHPTLPTCGLFLLNLPPSPASSFEWGTQVFHMSTAYLSLSQCNRQAAPLLTAGVIPSTLHPWRKSQRKPNSIEADCPDLVWHSFSLSFGPTTYQPWDHGHVLCSLCAPVSTSAKSS